MERNAGSTTSSGEASFQCLLCGGMRHRPIFSEFGIDILRCRQCGHVFSSFAADPHYDGYWGETVPEGDHTYWSRARARMHQEFFERFIVGRSGRLLDMGCGLGFFLKAIEVYSQWETYGCEISPAAVRYAHETLGLDNVTCGRLEDIGLPHGSFDIITMWDLIEHVPGPDPLLRRCNQLLREGGVCFLRTPNAGMQLPRARLKKLLRGMQPGLVYLQARDHLHHYSMTGIRRLLNRNGFSRVQFVHLHPIETVSGSGRGLRQGAKNASFRAVRALATLSGGRLNLDNLFVVGRKEVRAR
jgi:SAM-dependent methyltransferase